MHSTCSLLFLTGVAGLLLPTAPAMGEPLLRSAERAGQHVAPLPEDRSPVVHSILQAVIEDPKEHSMLIVEPDGRVVWAMPVLGFRDTALPAE